MKNITFKTAQLLSAALLITFASCKKDDKTPAPVEQELITTVKLKFRNLTAQTAPVYYTYKVENGFNNATPGAVQIDTIRVEAGSVYQVETELYNEKANPVDTVSKEVIQEADKHLFLYISVPESGDGSLSSNGGGSGDINGSPFNQMIRLLAGQPGAGKLRVVLIHNPTNKTASTPNAAGGETDVDVTFPVIIR